MAASSKSKSNGSPKSKMNGQPSGSASSPRSSRSSPRKSKTTLTGWVLDKALKATVWWMIITLAFRCPRKEEDLTDSSSALCKPAIQIRQQAWPYVEPYYDEYLGPYVARAQPYIDRVDQQVYQPGLAAYQHYGAPRVAQAQKYSLEQWEKSVKPQLEIAKGKAGEQYQASLAPHVQKVQDQVYPHYDSLRTSATDIWELEVKPVYGKLSPYARKLYAQGQDFAVTTAWPQTQNAGQLAWAFWTRQVWPKVRVLYGENVEPQLNRITERLGRYKDGKKLEAEVESMESESYVDSITSEASSSVEQATASTSVETSSASPEPSVSVVEQFQTDLKHWETICAKAVGEGADDLTERIQDITSNQISSQAEGVGSALLVQLEETASISVSSFKLNIQQAVEQLPEDPEDSDVADATGKLLDRLRTIGKNVKVRAQAVRDWQIAYQQEVDDLVDKALQSTLETIDGIRDLRLTEIGRRYAEKELPHKEWSRYNELKKTTRGWRDDVEKVAQEHANVATAKKAGDEVLEQGMAIAEDAAAELGRLKDVAKWKIEANDSSDDFETKSMPPKAEKAKQKTMQEVEEAKSAVKGPSEQGTMESVISVASEEASKGTESAASAADEAGESASSAASVVAESASSVQSVMSESVADAASDATEAVVGSETPAAESLASSVSSKFDDDTLSPESASVISAAKEAKDQASESAADAASEATESAETAAKDFEDDVESATSEAAESASSVASDASESVETATPRVFAGAYAQIIAEAREPILDDEVDEESAFSGNVQSMASAAGDQAAALTQAVLDAIKPSATEQGSVDSAVSVANDEYEKAMEAASEVLFGTNQGAMESATSVAKERYEEAVEAASHAIYGTPAPTAAKDSVMSMAGDASDYATSQYSAAAGTQGAYESMSSIASIRLSEGLDAASTQYHSAKIAMGAEPTPASDAYAASVQAAYYQGIGLAHDQYSSFLEAASSVVGATPSPTGMESFVSKAQDTYSSALLAASENMQELMGEAQGAEQKVLDQISEQYNDAAAMASSQFDAASSHASEAIYGTEPPLQESVASRASENWEALIAQASERVYGTPPPFTEAVVLSAGAYAAQATQAAAEQYDAVQSLISELVHGHEADFTESVMSRFQSAYATGAPAAASSASSYASEAYASASSVVAAAFTPPAQLENFMDQFNAQLASAVDAASAQAYGTSTGPIDKATSAASSAASQASEAVYGHEAGGAEAAQSTLASLASAASHSLSEALYGAETPAAQAAESSAVSVYASLTSQAVEQASAASRTVSSAVYGEEQSYMEGMQEKIALAVQQARGRIEELGGEVSGSVKETLETVEEKAEEVVGHKRDEL